MSDASTISPAIIAQLYEEALVLADEVRATFDQGAPLGEPRDSMDDRQVAMSCEALRTTTRMMHAIAWLLNQRAFHQGQMSEFQLRRHGRLPGSEPAVDSAHLAHLPLHVTQVVEQTVIFHKRIERLDAGWRERFEPRPTAVQHLRERLDSAFIH